MPTRPYTLHPAYKRMQGFVDRLAGKTGRGLDEWLALIAEDGPASDRERRAWLQTAHGLGRDYAMTLTEYATGRGGAKGYDPERLVAAQYAGPKKGLLPIYERVLELAFDLGPDVKVSPAKTIVPLYRKHVFAHIQPATRTRVDLGLALRGSKPAAPLIDTGGHAKGDRITHRIPLAAVTQIDSVVERWLRIAYEADG